jgi:hypothetical protein
MRIFISQSKPRSLAVAQALRKWIPQVIQAADEVWVSQEDIGKGTSWDEEVAGILEVSDFGIVCITPENKTEPWLLYEAGALSKHRKTSTVCTFLFDIKPVDVQSPLSKFQHTMAADKDDVFKMMQSINAAVQKKGEKSLLPEVLRNAFDNLWPALERDLQAILPSQSPVTDLPKDSEKIDEILETVRGLERRIPGSGSAAVWRKFMRDSNAASLPNFSEKERHRLNALLQARPNNPDVQAVLDVIVKKCLENDIEAAKLYVNEGWEQYRMRFESRAD